MTVIVGCIACVLAVVLANFSAEIAGASTTRMRAQTAADAASLAAVAESGPYGDGDPRGSAVKFARLNEARLIECLCEPGATAMQVTVAVEDIIARSRAVLDVDALEPLDIDATAGLHPGLERSIERLIAASQGAVTVGSGWRSRAEQTELWTQALERYGSAEIADDWVARPGHSMHERGLAVDLDGDVELAARLVRELSLPLHRPLSHEPWHFELIGAR